MHPETDHSEIEAAVLLNSVPGLGPTRISALVDAFGSMSAAASAPSDALVSVHGIGPVIAAQMAQAARSFDPAFEIRRAGRMGVEILVKGCPGYPQLLDQVCGAPIVLYVRGSVEALSRPSVAIVGTRVCSMYGRMQAEKLARSLARFGVVTVSGLARGIDTAAHRAALEAGGATVAVLGCGLDRPYPPENADLLESVARSGAAVSEFPLGTPPLKNHFPRRNRIISGLSLGVVVIEASHHSGSLITAKFAAEQNREVFAVPGKIDSVRSEGTNALIRDGAKLVSSVTDIIEEIGVQARAMEDSNAPQRALPAAPADGPGAAILEALDGETLDIDEIICRTGLQAQQVAAALMMLEMKRLVTQSPGKRFSTTEKSPKSP